MEPTVPPSRPVEEFDPAIQGRRLTPPQSAFVDPGVPAQPRRAADSYDAGVAHDAVRDAYGSPEGLARAKRDQVLGRYRQRVAQVRALLARYGTRERAADPDGYQRAVEAYRASQQLLAEAESAVESQAGRILDASQVRFAPVDAPAGNGIELDPRHQRPRQGLGGW